MSSSTPPQEGPSACGICAETTALSPRGSVRARGLPRIAYNSFELPLRRQRQLEGLAGDLAPSRLPNEPPDAVFLACDKDKVPSTPWRASVMFEGGAGLPGHWVEVTRAVQD